MYACTYVVFYVYIIAIPVNIMVTVTVHQHMHLKLLALSLFFDLTICQIKPHYFLANIMIGLANI